MTRDQEISDWRATVEEQTVRAEHAEAELARAVATINRQAHEYADGIRRATADFNLMVTRAERAEALLNTPEMADFIEGVKREAAHQVQRWGYAHDRSKSAENWYWLVGYLAGKALRSAITGDREKAQHHTISSAAALFNWHTAITHDTTGAGVGQDADLRATNPKDARAAADADA